MSPDGPSSSRRELLINGRRVRISDLIDAGLLKPGDELFYSQRLGETPYQAVVTDRGRLKIADGREFNTPSRAAATVANMRAVPGWAVWRVGVDGPTLHQLRLQLLKDVAEEVTADQEAPEDVREFIKLWGLGDRDRVASELEP